MARRGCIWCCSCKHIHTSLQATRDGLHVLEIFGGAGLGVLRAALSAVYTIRYTYVDQDPIIWRIAKTHFFFLFFKELVQQLQRQYPHQLPKTALLAFDKRLSQTVECISNLLFGNLAIRHGPVDLLGGS